MDIAGGFLPLFFKALFVKKLPIVLKFVLSSIFLGVKFCLVDILYFIFSFSSVVKCPAIKVPSHGTVYPASCKIPSGVNYKTDCFFTCNASNNYQLEGSPRVSCLENGSWSSDVSRVICKGMKYRSEYKVCLSSNTEF